MSKRRTCESCEGSGQVAEECIATPVKMPRWDADPVVIKNGWNTPEKCGNCGEPNPALAAAQSVVEDLEGALRELTDALTNTWFVGGRSGGKSILAEAWDKANVLLASLPTEESK